MNNKKNNKGLFIGLLLALLFLRSKKGAGTTLFGIGTQIDLSKPIEDLQSFQEASREMQQAGYEGTINPKGLYYQIDEGEAIRIASKIVYSDGSESETTFESIFSPARRIYNFQMQYAGALPPLLFWQTRTPFAEVLSNGQSRTGAMISLLTPLNGLTWSKFKKQ